MRPLPQSGRKNTLFRIGSRGSLCRAGTGTTLRISESFSVVCALSQKGNDDAPSSKADVPQWLVLLLLLMALSIMIIACSNKIMHLLIFRACVFVRVSALLFIEFFQVFNTSQVSKGDTALHLLLTFL
jgi:hypothetical protein